MSAYSARWRTRNDKIPVANLEVKRRKSKPFADYSIPIAHRLTLIASNLFNLAGITGRESALTGSLATSDVLPPMLRTFTLSAAQMENSKKHSDCLAKWRTRSKSMAQKDLSSAKGLRHWRRFPGIWRSSFGQHSSLHKFAGHAQPAGRCSNSRSGKPPVSLTQNYFKKPLE
jgi:hypothetical protein